MIPTAPPSDGPSRPRYRAASTAPTRPPGLGGGGLSWAGCGASRRARRATTNFVAILRLASSIISSPNITAPCGRLRWSGLLVGLEDVERPVELLLGRREHLVDDRHLVGVQRPLAVVAEDAGPRIAEVAQAVEVADLQVRAVDHLQAVGAPGHEDLREHVVEVVAGVLGDLHPAGEDRHLRRGGEVGRAEHDRLEPVRRGADLLDVDEPPGGLDLGLDPDPAPAADGLLDLGEQQVERADLGGRLHLREHQLVEPLRRRPRRRAITSR